MKSSLRACLVIFASVLSCAHALESRNDVNVTALELQPPCVKRCGEQATAQTYACQPSEPCYCQNDTPRSRALMACLKRNCFLDDQLAAQKFQADTCGLPHHNEQAEIRATIYPLFGLAIVITVARLLSRWPRLQGAGFWWDDLVVFLCAFPVTAFPVDSEMSLHFGLGRDMWDLSGYEVTHFLKWFYIAEPLYIVSTRLTKLSLVLLYLRLWPDRGTAFRYTCLVVAALLAASIPAAVLPVLFQCRPVSYYWIHLNSGTGGSCINQTALSIANAVIVIFFDLVVLLLPVRNLLRVPVSLRMRLGVLSVFLVGFAVTACSCVRLSYITLYSRSSMNPTHDYRGLAMWSHIEVYLSLVCCSMPQMPGLLRRTWNLLTKNQACRSNSSDSVERAGTKLWGDKYAAVDTD